MKKVILTLFLFVLLQLGYSQVFYNPISNNLRYAGAMNNEVMELLNTQEKSMLNDCIRECGIHPDSILWITKEVYDKLDNPNYYNTKMVYKASTDTTIQVKKYEGENTLNKPQFIIFIDRFDNETEITLQMYY